MADNAVKSGAYDPDAILELYESALGNSGDMTLEDYYECAYLLARVKRYGESDALLNHLSACPATYSSNWWRYKIEKDKGNFEQADSLLEESIRMQNLLVRETISQSVFKSQSDHFRHAMLSVRQEKTILRQRCFMAILSLMLALAFITFLFMRKRRLMAEENDRLLMTVDESEKMLGIMRLDFESKCSVMEEERAARKKKVMELQKITRQVSSEIGKILSEISVQSGKQSKFEARINRDADNIIAKIRKDYPRYSEDDIRLICYIIAGFDATAISVLMGITGENARVKKHRIRGRLLRDTGANAELYRIWLE